MKRTSWILCACVALVASTAQADPAFRITEAYVGLSGPDGTEDWIEVTNLGDMVGDTGTLLYDDESALINDEDANGDPVMPFFDPSIGGVLDSFLLAPGESAIFLVDDSSAESIDDFVALWGSGINVGLTNGGGSLGGGGDQANLFDATTFALIDSEDTPGGLSGATSTIDLRGPAALSVLGEDGAFESGPFVNDGLNPVDPFEITLVGSPGIGVPEPTAALLVASAFGVFAFRSRR